MGTGPAVALYVYGSLADTRMIAVLLAQVSTVDVRSLRVFSDRRLHGVFRVEQGSCGLE
jgi:hypothetical protein